MSGCDNNSLILFGLTLPPYWILTSFAATESYSLAIFSLITLHTSWALSAVAVLPVPIAQIGSYTITIVLTSSISIPFRAFSSYDVTTSLVLLFSHFSNVSPQQIIGTIPFDRIFFLLFY
jgi:hypothetical protein